MLQSPSRFCANQIIGRFINECCPHQDLAVLDVGCGAGDYCRYFTSLGRKGKYLGIDIQKSPLWRNRTENNLDISYSVFNAEDLENLNQIFNFIISIQALEHIKYDKKAMKGINQCLGGEGRFLLTVPSKFSLLLYGPHGHRRYSIKAFRQLAKESGFVVEEIIKVGGLSTFFLHFLIWTLPAIVCRLKIWRFYEKYRFLNELVLKMEKFACQLDKRAKCLESGYLAVLKKNEQQD